MYYSEDEARSRWCPFARVEGNNRIFNTLNDGFKGSPQPYHCIASECMLWREVSVSHLKTGAGKNFAHHGYCGMGDKPEFG